MTDTPTQNPFAAAKAVYADMLRSRLADMADAYRRIADDIDRLAARVDEIGTFGTVTAAGLAHDAIHAAAWGAANSSAAAVVSAAADYDHNVGGAS